MPSSLRVRLVVGAAGLVLLAVVLASALSAGLFGRRLMQSAQFDMARSALRAAERLEAAAPTIGSDRRQLMDLLRDTQRQSRIMGRLVLVDGNGAFIVAMPPPRGPLPARAPTTTSRIVPRPMPASGEPEVMRTRSGDWPAQYFATVPVPLLAARLGLAEAHVAIVRPARELRDLWLTMVPSVALAGLLGLIVSGIAALALSRTVTRPIEAMTHAARRIAGGDYAVRVSESGANEIANLASSFNAMARDVGEAHRRQRELVVNVGHDLRTPLTTISGFAEALLDGTADDIARRGAAAEAIAAAARRMTSQVEEILELARLEGHAAGVDRALVPVRLLLEAVRDDLSAEASARNVKISIDSQTSISVWADGRWLGRAIQNVLSNAIRFSTTNGEVRVSASRDLSNGGSSPVHTGGPPNELGAVTIVVEDDGPGISAADLPRVFERFYRADHSRSGSGSGLGLAIAHEIVVAHRGTIDIDSEPGAGTRVIVRLPGAPAADPRVDRSSNAESQA